MKKQRILAIILIAMFSSLIMFSLFYVAAESDHNCAGDNCPICYQINMCNSTSKSLSDGLTATAFSFVAILSIMYMLLLNADACISKTLVSLKVKLLD